MVLYSRLLEDRELSGKLSEKVNLLKKFIGPDSLYAVITTEMKEFFDSFPDLVFIRNDRGTFLYGLYKGLRKLRGNDVLVLDPSRLISLEKIKDFISKRRKNVLYTSEGEWKGIALFRLIDLDYLIRTLESFLSEERDLWDVVEKVRKDYGIEYETV